MFPMREKWWKRVPCPSHAPELIGHRFNRVQVCLAGGHCIEISFISGITFSGKTPEPAASTPWGIPHNGPSWKFYSHTLLQKEFPFHPTPSNFEYYRLSYCTGKQWFYLHSDVAKAFEYFMNVSCLFLLCVRISGSAVRISVSLFGSYTSRIFKLCLPNLLCTFLLLAFIFAKGSPAFFFLAIRTIYIHCETLRNEDKPKVHINIHNLNHKQEHRGEHRHAFLQSFFSVNKHILCFSEIESYSTCCLQFASFFNLLQHKCFPVSPGVILRALLFNGWIQSIVKVTQFPSCFSRAAPHTGLL